jgi:phenylalanine-4-hydroxylase
MTLEYKTQQEVIDSLPVHLRPFVAVQKYEDYTPRDQAVWRFLMQQLVENLSASAHPLYLQGLKETGIDVDSIPKIEVMNHCLEKIGWRAAVVDGFIPAAIFIEFLAHRVLVVAVNIRSIKHMLYTPAPDIIHESAGHAPFLIDVDYAEYLERVGQFGRRVIAHKSDLDTFEAIRHLSIVKESPDSSESDIEKAEQRLEETIKASKGESPSEQSLLARLQWWTTEYGLVGNVNDYQIFGAGLLSSLGESVNCLDDEKVKKIPLTLDAINQPFDITQEQPQLFVAKNCRHLSQVAEEFAKSTCYCRGGAESLRKAVSAKTVNTAVYNSGVEVSGVFTRTIENAVGDVVYFNTTGPTQLSFKEREINGHGTQYHAPGFGSPVGKVQSMDKCLSSYSIDDLKRFEIEVGKAVKLEFLSGICVEGVLNTIYRRDGKNLIFSFSDCWVKTFEGECLFEPDWGTFDMAVGEQISSVYGGSADPSNYPLYTKPTDSAHAPETHDSQTLSLFTLYKEIRNLRQADANPELITRLIDTYLALSSNEWLLAFELAELMLLRNIDDSRFSYLIQELIKTKENANDQSKQLIQYALQRLKQMETS